MTREPTEVGGTLADLGTEYELLGELGRGGMAVVYHARDRALGREVAVKVIRSHYVDDAEVLARFEREARLAARLEHPNVVRVYAVRVLPNAGLALVMEYVPGITLKDEIRNGGAFHSERAEQILRDVALALGCAHAHGIVHRDVKPDNIFIDQRDGRALLADFGIARPLVADTELTVGGIAMGTPAYMSPEQIDGRPLDARCDIYGLGLVAWEMLTGQAPWQGESFYSVLHKQKTAALPPLRQLRPDVPARLRGAIERAIEKDPADRWASAEEFIEGLQARDERGWEEWLRLARKLVRRLAPRVAGVPPNAAAAVPDAATIVYRRESTGEVPAVPAASPEERQLDATAALPELAEVEERAAWSRFPRLLGRVLQRGDRVEIVRDGQTVCALVSAQDVARLAADDARKEAERRRLAEWLELRAMLDRRTLEDAAPNRHPRWPLYPGAGYEFARLVKVGALTPARAGTVMAAYGSIDVFLSDTPEGVEQRTAAAVSRQVAEQVQQRLRKEAGPPEPRGPAPARAGLAEPQLR